MAKSSPWAPASIAAAAVMAYAGQAAQPIFSVRTQTIGCERRLQQVADVHGLTLQRGERLVSDRDGRLRRDAAPDEVRMHYLVDRQIGGCPVPVVSSTRLDDANRAMGRVIGRDSAPRR